MNDYVSSWDFTLANYGAVWAFLVQFGLLLLFLMLGNILRRTVPLFRKCLVPSALLGGGLLLISLAMDRILGRESMGGGDIKLLAVVGLYLGPIGAMFALVLACVIGLLFHALRRGEGARAFPFGPSIAVAAAAMLLFGAPLVAWYRGLLG
jgi:leader peptidase (prepilin peptidase)/N-methyltransferase